jgi:hypothetical protein
MKKEKKQLAVKIEELPYRAHIIDSDSLGKIFGGCIEEGQKCSGVLDCNCCKTLICKKSHDLSSWICEDGNY